MNFFTFLGIFLLLFVFYRLLIEIQDNYENKNEDPFVLQLVQKIRHIDPRVDEVIDHLRFFEGDKSYTLDKKYVFICKKDKKTNEQYHQNQLILVLIHEISHALCDEIGHTPKFDMIFEDLLAKATQQGLYDESIPNVENYCE
jgi:hypothetical protein